MPINIQNLLQELIKYHHYELAYIMGAIYENYQNFEDFFVVSLADRLKWQVSVNNFYQADQKKRLKIVNKRTN